MIYLASPYTHVDAAVRESRFDAACLATSTLMRAGLTVYAPIVHSLTATPWFAIAMGFRSNGSFGKHMTVNICGVATIA